MSVTNLFRPGTIHIYQVPFVDKNRSKPRPVLIITLPNGKGDVMGTNTDKIMNNTFWIGVYPGLTEEMLSFVVEKIEAFFGVNF